VLTAFLLLSMVGRGGRNQLAKLVTVASCLNSIMTCVCSSFWQVPLDPHCVSKVNAISRQSLSLFYVLFKWFQTTS